MARTRFSALLDIAQPAFPTPLPDDAPAVPDGAWLMVQPFAGGTHAPTAGPQRVGTAVPFAATPTVAEPQLNAATYGAGALYGNNITQAWKWTAGKGSTVALIDDGFTPSAIANFNTALSRSFGAAGIGETSGGFHGTTTSGMIGANGNAGIVGVASGATVVGVKVSFGSVPLSSFVSALSYAAATAGVVNNSWGFSGYNPGALSQQSYAAWNTAMQVAVGSGRNGLGAAVVFAAGNDRGSANDIGVQPLIDDPRVIAVAATTASGTVASYSTGGSGLLVAALGDNVAVPAPFAGAYMLASGTSYAAPLVSGIVAMMLSVNPNLGWRDIQEILAASSYAPPPSAGSFTTDAATNWNGGGMHFSNDLGFGIVDAAVAVNLSRAWAATLTSANMLSTTVSQTQSFSAPINAISASSVVETTAMRVEHVQIHIADANLPIARTKLVLISPSGTRSVVLNDTGLAGSRDMSGGVDLTGDTVTSNAFWGEMAKGTWTLQVQDTGGPAVGTVANWSLTVLGDAATAVTAPLVFTPEFATLAAASPSRTIITSAGSPSRTLDLIDLPNASAINLAGGAGTIDGVAVKLANAFTNLNGDGSTGSLLVTAASFGSAIAGGDGPTTILGAGGSDTISAGAGATLIRANNDTQLIFQAGGGTSTLVGGQGALRLAEGAGADTLLIQNGAAGGLYGITGFVTGLDVVHLVGYAGTQAATALVAQKSDLHGGSLLTLSDGTRIDFAGLTRIQSSAFA